MCDDPINFAVDPTYPPAGWRVGISKGRGWLFFVGTEAPPDPLIDGLWSRMHVYTKALMLIRELRGHAHFCKRMEERVSAGVITKTQKANGDVTYGILTSRRPLTAKCSAIRPEGQPSRAGTC